MAFRHAVGELEEAAAGCLELTEDSRRQRLPRIGELRLQRLHGGNVTAVVAELVEASVDDALDSVVAALTNISERDELVDHLVQPFGDSRDRPGWTAGRKGWTPG